jgi:hypothetical protein
VWNAEPPDLVIVETLESLPDPALLDAIENVASTTLPGMGLPPCLTLRVLSHRGCPAALRRLSVVLVSEAAGLLLFAGQIIGEAQRTLCPRETREGRILGTMATDPIDLSDDLAVAVSRARRALEERGELRPPVIRPFVSPLDDEERAAVLEALKSGAYERAVTEIGEQDPDLADG